MKKELIGQVLLIFFGICVAFVFIETILWIAGTRYTQDTSAKARVTQDDKNRIRIVALGESTTAPLFGPAWPELLEKELNKRAGKQAYRVYNLGVSGSNSSAIYRRVVTEAMSLHPQIVITMMGINDIKYLALPVEVPTVLSKMIDQIKSSRTYKLFAIIDRLIRSNQKRALVMQAFACKDDVGDHDWIYTYLPQYESMIRALYPDRYVGQFSNTPQDQAAANLLIKFLTKYPFSYQAYEVIVDHYAARSAWKDVLVWTGKYQDMQPLIHACILTNSSAKKETKEVMSRHVEDIGVFMDALSVIAHNLIAKNIQNGAFYDEIKAGLGTESMSTNVNTAQIYRQINQYLNDRDIQHVAMQYPLLPLHALQAMFKDTDVVSFVDNEQNFQDALKTRSYSDVFVDNFAGIFGHTTTFGSQMIASSAADTIMELESLKNN